MIPIWPPWWPPGPTCPDQSALASWQWSRQAGRGRPHDRGPRTGILTHRCHRIRPIQERRSTSISRRAEPPGGGGVWYRRLRIRRGRLRAVPGDRSRGRNPYLRRGFAFVGTVRPGSRQLLLSRAWEVRNHRPKAWPFARPDRSGCRCTSASFWGRHGGRTSGPRRCSHRSARAPGSRPGA